MKRKLVQLACTGPSKITVVELPAKAHDTCIACGDGWVPVSDRSSAVLVSCWPLLFHPVPVKQSLLHVGKLCSPGSSDPVSTDLILRFN